MLQTGVVLSDVQSAFEPQLPSAYTHWFESLQSLIGLPQSAVERHSTQRPPTQNGSVLLEEQSLSLMQLVSEPPASELPEWQRPARHVSPEGQSDEDVHAWEASAGTHLSFVQTSP